MHVFGFSFIVVRGVDSCFCVIVLWVRCGFCGLGVLLLSLFSGGCL